MQTFKKAFLSTTILDVLSGFLLFMCLINTAQLCAQAPVINVPNPQQSTVIKKENVDPAAFMQWVDGKELPVTTKKGLPLDVLQVLWTSTTTPGYSGALYGESTTLSPRHLRIGFHNPIIIGSLLTNGGGLPGVLKPGAPYPGNLNDDSQWIPAQRMVNGALSNKEAAKFDCVMWVFPKGTNTRAIRFTHAPQVTDATYSNTLIGALILPDRLINVAGTAAVSTRLMPTVAKMVTNEVDDNWRSWGSRVAKDAPPKDTPVIAKANPEWLVLTWPSAIELNGLAAFWAGFTTAEVEAYTGPDNIHPLDAPLTNWQTIGVYNNVVTANVSLWPNFFNFGKVVKTRAVRLKITAPISATSQFKDNAQEGRRIWLAELMALQLFNDNNILSETTAQLKPATGNPPIALPFTLKEGGYVTLVIEDKNGVRVRNLITETWFDAGKNTAWWDGTDDLGRDAESAGHGVYNIPAKLVAPGNYKVRGVVHGKVSTSYEFSVYAPGTPPWYTNDHTGGWLSNHTAPQSALFLPAGQSPTGEPSVYLGCYIGEGTDALALVDLDGKKIEGRLNVGSSYAAAPYLARDSGKNAEKGIYAYSAAVWETGKKSGKGMLYVNAISADKDKEIQYSIGNLESVKDRMSDVSGLAVHNGIAVVSLVKKNKLVIIDCKAQKVLYTVTLNAPRGLAFDANGNLLALSGNKLLRYKGIPDAKGTIKPQALIEKGLDAPTGITLDTQGNIYISNWGNSHQVKIFTATGNFVRAIGKAGAPVAGPYDPLHMHNPEGITIDSRQQLWVAEKDFLPKRVSVWTLDGEFIKAFYGPAKYGGGGWLDPVDKTKFYYSEVDKGVMEFTLDWKTGENTLTNILYRKTPAEMEMAVRSTAPEMVIYHNGQRYFTNCFNSSPTSGHNTAFLFTDRGGIIYPVAAMGQANAWPVLQQDKFKAILPAGLDLNSKSKDMRAFFIWTDGNHDAQVQPNEVVIKKGEAGGVSVMQDLSFCLSYKGNAVQFSPVSVSAQGVPKYDFTTQKTLAKGVAANLSVGGNQILTNPDGQTVVVQGIAPFDLYSISGVKNGQALWAYPNMWPGLHASHTAPVPDFSGEIIGTGRVLGGYFNVKGATAGPLWAINSNHGMVYIFTADGLFVTTLFKSGRAGKLWKMPAAKRGMSMDELSLGDENFWPTITAAADGNVYLVDGNHSSLIHVNGLQTLQRLPDLDITVLAADLNKSREYAMQAETGRKEEVGQGVLHVKTLKGTMVVDGRFTDWDAADWVNIDKTGIRASFNSKSKPYDVTAAIAIDNSMLYAGFKTGNKDLLKNSGEIKNAPFKTGGALDIMIGTNPNADKNRTEPVAGDLRLLITMVKAKPYALLYRAVVSGTTEAGRVPFSSPWRTVTFDEVKDVSSQIKLALTAEGNFEFSIPLSVIGLEPKPGMAIKGDIGILRGDGAQTISRVYWANKAAGIISDVPSEAELTPSLWGEWRFE